MYENIMNFYFFFQYCVFNKYVYYLLFLEGYFEVVCYEERVLNEIFLLVRRI